MKLIRDIITLAEERETRAAFFGVAAFSALMISIGLYAEQQPGRAGFAGVLGGAFALATLASTRDARRLRDAIDPDTGLLKRSVTRGPQ